MNFFKKLLGKKPDPLVTLTEGDIFYTFHNNQYHLYKLLKIDEYGTFHVLGYAPLNELPPKEKINELDIRIYHFPIAPAGFPGSMLFAKSTVTNEDLGGYHTYLEMTQQDNAIIEEADRLYKKAYYLTDEKKHEEAIANYSKAIELIPTFFEAIDNRAFCKMDLGRWEEAIEDFKLSLQVNPNTVLAEVSIGECYLRLGNFTEAKNQFRKALDIDPNHKAAKEFLLRAIASENLSH